MLKVSKVIVVNLIFHVNCMPWFCIWCNVYYFSFFSACNRATDCETCISQQISFQCKWCGIIGRCSDGVDWHRQEWLNANCVRHVSSREEQQNSGRVLELGSMGFCKM